MNPVDPSISSTAAVLFQSLSGWWSLNRTMAGFGKMDGGAAFTRLDERTLHYREEGELQLESGLSFSAFRELFYGLEEEIIAVRFQLRQVPETLLFRLNLEGKMREIWPARARDTHYCGSDTYEGEYYFESPDRLRTRIAVRGPRKNTVIDSLLIRSVEPKSVRRENKS